MRSDRRGPVCGGRSNGGTRRKPGSSDLPRACALAAAILAAGLAGCGGGSAAAPQGTQYAYVSPAAGSQRLYAVTIVDNAGNTIQESLLEAVLQQGGGGSYTYRQSDPNNDVVTVDGTTYSVTPETVTSDSSGRELSYSFVSGTIPVGCTVSPYGAGPAYPVTVGASWSTNYTVACSNGAGNSFSQNGTVVDVESVTVPAGTFSALKLQSTIVYTDAAGTTRTQSVTNWRDVATGRSVKQVYAIGYGGTPVLVGHPVSRTLELVQSSS